jgi:hypothetical protein
MTTISTFLANKQLDHTWGKTAYTMPTVFLGLYTTNPTMPAGTGGVEVSGGSYARVALATLIGAASAGANSNSGTITFPTATASWGTIVGVGVFDALTVGNLLKSGALSVSKVIGIGDTFQMTAGNLTDSLS